MQSPVRERVRQRAAPPPPPQPWWCAYCNSGEHAEREPLRSAYRVNKGLKFCSQFCLHEYGRLGGGGSGRR